MNQLRAPAPPKVEIDFRLTSTEGYWQLTHRWAGDLTWTATTDPRQALMAAAHHAADVYNAGHHLPAEIKHSHPKESASVNFSAVLKSKAVRDTSFVVSLRTWDGIEWVGGDAWDSTIFISEKPTEALFYGATYKMRVIAALHKYEAQAKTLRPPTPIAHGSWLQGNQVFTVHHRTLGIRVHGRTPEAALRQFIINTCTLWWDESIEGRVWADGRPIKMPPGRYATQIPAHLLADTPPPMPAFGAHLDGPTPPLSWPTGVEPSPQPPTGLKPASTPPPQPEDSVLLASEEVLSLAEDIKTHSVSNNESGDHDEYASYFGLRWMLSRLDSSEATGLSYSGEGEAASSHSSSIRRFLQREFPDVAAVGLNDPLLDVGTTAAFMPGAVAFKDPAAATPERRAQIDAALSGAWFILRTSLEEYAAPCADSEYDFEDCDWMIDLTEPVPSAIEMNALVMEEWTARHAEFEARAAVARHAVVAARLIEEYPGLERVMVGPQHIVNLANGETLPQSPILDVFRSGMPAGGVAEGRRGGGACERPELVHHPEPVVGVQHADRGDVAA